MKRFLWIICLFAIVGCDKSDALVQNDNISADDEVIRLEASANGISTKGNLVEAAAQMETLGLYCDHHPGDEAWSTETTFDHMSNKQVQYNQSTASWDYVGGDVTWGYESIDDQYTFMGYSPYDSSQNNIDSRISEGQLVVDFTASTTFDSQVDLMIATPLIDNFIPAGGVVTINFNHAQAAATFNLTGDYNSVESITITNLYTQGEVMCDPESGVEWSGRAGSGSYTITKSHIDNGDYLMLIPQTLSSTTLFVVTLTDKTTKTLTTDLELSPNTKYTFSLYVGDYIAFSGISVGEWQQSSTTVATKSAGVRPTSFTANCYMIHPSDGFSTYYIDINSQINYFWDPINGYVTQNNDDYLIDADNASSLTADLLWDTTGGLADSNFAVVTSGFSVKESVTPTSAPDFTTTNCTVALRITMPTNIAEGNALVAVKMDGNTLWSWHLWITDYNPDRIALESVADASTYLYTATGYTGAVHRYRDSDTASNFLSYSEEGVWRDGGIYDGLFIMDRNLGYLTSAYSSDSDNTLHYQFGRKDPFPCSGTGISTLSNANNLATFAEAIGNPTVFYYNATQEYWCSEDQRTDYFWSDYYVKITDHDQKSLFDPTPLGWRIPIVDTWTDFSTTTAPTTTSARYYNVTGGSTDIILPYTGVRNYHTGTVSYLGSYGYLRCGRAKTDVNSYYLTYNASDLFLPDLQGWSRAHGLAMRAVQYNATN